MHITETERDMILARRKHAEVNWINGNGENTDILDLPIFGEGSDGTDYMVDYDERNDYFYAKAVYPSGNAAIFDSETIAGAMQWCRKDDETASRFARRKQSWVDEYGVNRCEGCETKIPMGEDLCAKCEAYTDGQRFEGKKATITSEEYRWVMARRKTAGTVSIDWYKQNIDWAEMMWTYWGYGYTANIILEDGQYNLSITNDGSGDVVLGGEGSYSTFNEASEAAEYWFDGF